MIKLGGIFRAVLLILLVGGVSISSVVRSEGEGCSSDIKKAKREALDRAKLNAIETHVGTLISTKSLILNSRLVRDIIQTRALGSVRLVGKPEFSEPRLSGRDQVCVSVRASFEVPQEGIKPADFGLILLLDRKELRKGEEIKFWISSQKPCYPYIFSLDVKGRVYRLFPNPAQDTFLLKRKTALPTDRMVSENYRIVVFPTKGVSLPQREEIIFVCTKERIKSFEEFFPSAFADDLQELRKLLTRNYHQSLERFNEILTQIGAENYDMVGDHYLIR